MKCTGELVSSYRKVREWRYNPNYGIGDEPEFIETHVLVETDALCMGCKKNPCIKGSEIYVPLLNWRN